VDAGTVKCRVTAIYRLGKASPLFISVDDLVGDSHDLLDKAQRLQEFCERPSKL